MVRLKAFQPFSGAEQALASAQTIGKGSLTEDLKTFITENIPKSKKKAKNTIAVLDPKLAQKISEELAFECKTSEFIFELFRGIRTHFTKFLQSAELKETDLIKAQLGLTHAFSRSRIEFDVNR